MHVDGAFLDVEVAAPHPVQQLTTGAHAFRVSHQEMQHAELGRTHRDRLTCVEPGACQGAFEHLADGGLVLDHQDRVLHRGFALPRRLVQTIQSLEHYALVTTPEAAFVTASHCRSSRCTETGPAVPSSCANNDTRSSSSIQR